MADCVSAPAIWSSAISTLERAPKATARRLPEVVGLVLSVVAAAALPLVVDTATTWDLGYSLTARVASQSAAAVSPAEPIAIALPEGPRRAESYRYDDRSSLARMKARDGPGFFAPNTARSFGNYGGEFLDDAIRSPVVRPDLGNLSSKIQRQMGPRGWTPGLIDEAVQQGQAFPAVNKLGGANTPATRYVHPQTGQSVVIDNATGEVIQVGGPGFRY